MEIFFVATESDKTNNKNKIYAGDWCFFSNQEKIKSEISKIKSLEIYSDKEKLKKEITVLKIFFFNELKQKLNNLHNLSYSDKFWKFLLDPWLSCFLDSYITKWKIIDNLENSYEKVFFNQYKDLKKNYSFDVRDYRSKFNFNDDFHQKQFQNILEFKSKISPNSFGNIKVEEFKKKITKNKKISFFYFLIKKLSIILGFFSKNNNFFIFNSSLSIKEYLILNFKLNQFPHFIFDKFNKEKYIEYFQNFINKDQRNKIKIKADEHNNLKIFLSEIILEELPICYVEKFEQIINDSKKISINSKIIVTSVELLHNSLFKFWAALMQETKKSIIIYPDHGGTLGIIDSNFDLLDYVDYRFTWHKPLIKNDIQVPSVHLSKIKDSRSNSNSEMDKILYISHNRKKYYHSFYDAPDGIKNLETIQQFKLLKEKLSNKIKKKFYIKTYTENDSNYWIKNNSWLDKNDDCRIILKKKEYFKTFKKSKIIICNYPKTALCQAMVSGPTIMLFDPNLWKQNEFFLDIEERLKDSKIFFNNGSEAAEHINLIWDDPLKWWNSNKVLKCREEFNNRFAMTLRNPIDQWAKELQEIDNRSKNFNLHNNKNG